MQMQKILVPYKLPVKVNQQLFQTSNSCMILISLNKKRTEAKGLI